MPFFSRIRDAHSREVVSRSKVRGLVPCFAHIEAVKKPSSQCLKERGGLMKGLRKLEAQFDWHEELLDSVSLLRA